MPPDIALIGLLSMLVVGAVCCAVEPRPFANILAVAIVLCIWFPLAVEIAFAPRVVLAVLLAVGSVGCIMCGGASIATKTFASVVITCFAAIVLTEFLGFEVASPAIADSYFRYVAIVPLSAAYGHLLVRGGRARQFGQAFLAIGLVASPLAVVEYVINRPLFANRGRFETYLGEQYRASLLSGQPLVLAILLLCAVAIAFVMLRGHLRWIAIAILVSGVAATDSRGALGLTFVFLALAVIWERFPRLHEHEKLFRAIFVTASAVAPFMMMTRYAGFAGITSSDPATASQQYRGALYSIAGRTLSDRPWGWGIQGLPPGIYTFRSPFGLIDASDSLDSEFVQLLVEFGYLGALALIVAIVVVALRLRWDRWWTLTAVLITAAGYYLSIHSWLGILSLWALSVGAAFADPPTIPETRPPGAQAVSDPPRSLARPVPGGIG
ncbi:O-antigen ligase family protein [Rhodococcus sp. NPDC003322]